uniref:Cyclin N-terminal domain-containing protein n=1 Tax=Strongyloides venezuelensis TaxID=75913 RepID=A0A0K0FPY3_STRVS
MGAASDRMYHLDSINEIKIFEETWPYVTTYVKDYRISNKIILQTLSYFTRIIPNTESRKIIKKKRRSCIEQSLCRLPCLPKYQSKGRNFEEKKGSSVEVISRVRIRIKGYFINDMPDKGILFIASIIASYYNIIFKTHIKYMYENDVKDSLISSMIKYFSFRSDINVRNDDLNVIPGSSMLSLYDSFYHFIPESLIGVTIDCLVIFSKEIAEYIAKRHQNFNIYVYQSVLLLIKIVLKSLEIWNTFAIEEVT